MNICYFFPKILLALLMFAASLQATKFDITLYNSQTDKTSVEKFLETQEDFIYDLEDHGLDIFEYGLSTEELDGLAKNGGFTFIVHLDSAVEGIVIISPTVASITKNESWFEQNEDEENDEEEEIPNQAEIIKECMFGIYKEETDQRINLIKKSLSSRCIFPFFSEKLLKQSDTQKILSEICTHKVFVLQPPLLIYPNFSKNLQKKYNKLFEKLDFKLGKWAMFGEMVYMKFYDTKYETMIKKLHKKILKDPSLPFHYLAD